MSATFSSELLALFVQEHRLFLQLAEAVQHHLLVSDSDTVLRGLTLLENGLAQHAEFEERCFTGFAWPACRWPVSAYQAEHQLLEHRLRQLRCACDARVSATTPVLQRRAWLLALQEAHRLLQVLEHHFDREETDWLRALMENCAADAQDIAKRFATQYEDVQQQMWRQAAEKFCAIVAE